jgi:hypothetical protein
VIGLVALAVLVFVLASLVILTGHTEHTGTPPVTTHSP